MSVWCELLTIISRRVFLRFAGILLLSVAIITTVFFGFIHDSYATTRGTEVIGFQGKLLDSSGNAVADGTYNIQFTIYQGGTGTAALNPGGTKLWSETYLNTSSARGVEVKNGTFSVNLGSRSAFGSLIDWSNPTLWLSMNVAGSATCDSFDSGECRADGEMLPMKRLTATPYAMSAGSVGGKTASQLVQLGQGVQLDSGNSSSIFINKTAGGNFIQLQHTATNIFSVTNSGDILFGGSSAHSIGIGSATNNAAGAQLSITAGNGGVGTGTTGGTLTLQGGNGGGTNGNGGDLVLDSGSATGNGVGGTISIGSQNAQSVTIGTDGTIRATFTDDDTLVLGSADNTTQPFTVQGADSSTPGVTGGSLSIQGGDATTGDTNGGDLILSGGSGSGDGATGLVVLGTPTFSTAEETITCDDTSASCTIPQTVIDSRAAAQLEATTEGREISVPDPSLKTAGRVFYLSSTAASRPFTLVINEGVAAQKVTMAPLSTTSLLWNGSDWTIAGTSGELQPREVSPADSPVESEELPVEEAEAPATGSLYYDTTLGKIQCFDNGTWGSCPNAPDTFVAMNPTYANTVTGGSELGELSSELCSGTLGINDGSDGNAALCDENETYNMYSWTSDSTATQTKSLFVSYALPENFSTFNQGSVSLLGRTLGENAQATLQIYKNSNEGLVACGSSLVVSSGDTQGWQLALAGAASDPYGCGFGAGDTIVFKIDLSASQGSSAHVSTLKFAYGVE